MLKIGTAALAAAATLAAALPGAAQEERKVTLDTQSEVAVTIYNRDLALIKELRSVDLTKGLNRLALIDVSGRMRPETAALTARSGPRVSLLEQNFNFDIMSPAKLLEKSVGREVRIVKVNPATGAETVLKAKVLSAAKGVVLQIGDRIETGVPGRIVFDKVPPNLRARPTLVIDLTAEAAGKADLELSYLSRGLSWRADYVGELGPDDKTLDLSGWVTLTNRSGTTYKNAKLQLVAGDVQQVRARMARIQAERVRRSMAGAPRMRQQAFFDYHLYTLDRPTTIQQNQIKQVALLDAPKVKTEKEYLLTSGAYYRSRNAGSIKQAVQVWLKFENKEGVGPNMPLPKGIVRIYKRNSEGKALFVGEDRIGHTPVGESVRLRMGNAFDVTAERRQTDYRREGLDKRTYETEHEITIRNAKPEPVTVTVREPVGGDWRVLKETLPHRKASSNLLEWKVPVPAKGKTVLTYRVRVRL
jgi:hypothetical protein